MYLQCVLVAFRSRTYLLFYDLFAYLSHTLIKEKFTELVEETIIERALMISHFSW